MRGQRKLACGARKTCGDHHNVAPDAGYTVRRQAHGRTWPANAVRGNQQHKERDKSCAILEEVKFLERKNDASGGDPRMIESGAIIF